MYSCKHKQIIQTSKSYKKQTMIDIKKRKKWTRSKRMMKLNNHR